MALQNPRKSRYKSCFVPKCNNSSVKTPEKVFLTVPKNEKLRQKWMRAARRADTVSPKSTLSCCEDHFDLEHDLESYVRYKLMGSKLFLKRDVVPHKFKCQESSLAAAALNYRVNILDENEMSGQSEAFPTEETEYDATFNGITCHTIDGTIILENSWPFSEAPCMETNDETCTSSSGEEPSIFSEEIEEDCLRKISLERTRKLLRAKPETYLGIPKHSWYRFQRFSEKFEYDSSTLTSMDVVLLVLKKVRLNESFKILGDDFGVSASQASQIFTEHVTFIADHLRTLIVRPDSRSVLKDLPAPFRRSYAKVQLIIHCLEIQVEADDAINRSLRLPDHVETTAIKYLISSTPNGVINFVSEGKSGRLPDLKLAEVSGFVDKLPSGAHVMANGEFKHLDEVLQSRGCKIVRPRTSSAKQKLSKTTAKKSSATSDLKIYIERTLRLIREFKFVRGVDTELLQYTDDVVNIICGLINLQSM